MLITHQVNSQSKDNKIDLLAKGERKSLALKAKKESSDEEWSTFGSEDEEYVMAVRDFKKFFKRRCFRCVDPNHLIGECPKPPKDKNKRAFVGGSWSDSGEEDDEKSKDKMCPLAAINKTRYALESTWNPTDGVKDSDALNTLRVIKCSSQPTRVTFSEHDSEITKDSKIIGRGYSQNSKAYIILNKYTMKIKESLNLTFNETPTPSKISPLMDDGLDEEEAIKDTKKKNLENDIEDKTLEIDKVVNVKESRNYPLENVIGNINQRTLRSQA
ncbi:zf-CCHC domain-containing protein [Tanacetum coccineum]